MAMVAPLQAIIDAELAAGNEISEIGADGPCELLVILRGPFHKNYLPLPDVEFVTINGGPQGWKAEYRYKGGLQTLAGGYIATPTRKFMESISRAFYGSKRKAKSG